MKAFRLHNPRTIEEALQLLEPERVSSLKTAVLAGGMDLVTELKEYLAQPDDIVNLKGIEGLSGIEAEPGGGVRIGALCTLARLEEHPVLQRTHAVLTQAAASVASVQIRSQATVGGNLNQRPRCWYYRNEESVCLKKGGTECFSYGGLNKYNAILGGGPSYIVHPSDLAPALLALDASVELVSRKGMRTVKIEKYFTLPSEGDVLRETALEPGEILRSVVIPPQKVWMRSTWLKFKEKSSFDWALSAVALCAVTDGKTIREARVALGGVAPVPWRAKAAEAALANAPMERKSFEAAAEAALRGAEPLSQNAYKIPLTKGLLIRALESLAG
ncbi:MAG: 4-hydroxybenzoyl-CoA reductase subunit beta [Planctomycetota bacterium]|jgi:xanthine dehydrogenase YagS FAD-binding subunit